MEIMGKKTFSPQQWEPVHSDSAEVRQAEHKEYSQNRPAQESLTEDVEYIVRQIETNCTDLTSGYENWRNIGFALSDAFGEQGRDFFHRISRFNKEYTIAETDKQYNAILASSRSGITIATLFKMAKDAGFMLRNSQNDGNGKMDKWQNGNIQIAKSPNCQIPNSGKTMPLEQPSTEKVDGRWVKDEENLPVLPDEVFTHLPSFLKEVVGSVNTNVNRDIILLGSLLALSSTLYNTYGVYDDRICYPNLYLFVVADAGMGKGALNYCRGLVLPLHKERLALGKERMQEYRQKKAENSKENAENMIEPPGMLMHIIPANSSASAFQKILNDNDGIGLMFETEGDTLSNTLRNDFGNYSDVMRKAFHHEPVSYGRRKENEMVEIPNPKLSIALSGTPEQIRNLIPDTENGLMSRFLYYHMKFKKGFGHVFVTTDPNRCADKYFEILGEKYEQMRQEYFRNGEVIFVMPPHLVERFEKYFCEVVDSCVEEIERRVQGLVFRIALMAYRIMMILNAIRVMSEDIVLLDKDCKKIMVCNDTDYSVAMKIVDTLFYHTIFYYMKLAKYVPQNMDKRKRQRCELLACLPPVFSKKEYKEATIAMNMFESTTNKWLDAFIRDGIIVRDAHGMYRKLVK